jgi:hypothetical protein
VGRAVRVGLRPENAEVFAKSDAPQGAIQCSVVEAVYQGAQILLELAPLGASEIRLRAVLPAANRLDSQMRLKAASRLRSAGARIRF